MHGIPMLTQTLPHPTNHSTMAPSTLHLVHPHPSTPPCHDTAPHHSTTSPWHPTTPPWLTGPDDTYSTLSGLPWPLALFFALFLLLDAHLILVNKSYFICVAMGNILSEKDCFLNLLSTFYCIYDFWFDFLSKWTITFQTWSTLDKANSVTL